MSFFNEVPLLPEDPILSLPIAFEADLNPKKVNLGIGSYKTADGSPLVFTSVKKAEVQLLQKNFNKEYLPIDGDPEFLQLSLQLLFGNDIGKLNPKHLYAAQSIGGSGALRIGGEFLVRNINKGIFLSQPTWPNHKLLFERAGLCVGSYPYYNMRTNQLDFPGLCEAIKNLPPSSVILLQASCHNPTGLDPTKEQWQELSQLIKTQQLLPFFDIAYQGFGSDLEKDAFPVRLFAQEGHEMLIAYSFAKNFGLYGERVGFLAFHTPNETAIPHIASQIKTIIRGNYSNPPLHGARVVKTILKSKELHNDWQTELENMRDRIAEMRIALVADLLAHETNVDFSYIHKHKGLFSISGLSPEQVLRLRSEFGIYMPTNGRINVAGLTTQNLDYVVKSIASVLEK